MMAIITALLVFLLVVGVNRFCGGDKDSNNQVEKTDNLTPDSDSPEDIVTESDSVLTNNKPPETVVDTNQQSANQSTSITITKSKEKGKKEWEDQTSEYNHVESKDQGDHSNSSISSKTEQSKTQVTSPDDNVKKVLAIITSGKSNGTNIIPNLAGFNENEQKAVRFYFTHALTKEERGQLGELKGKKKANIITELRKLMRNNNYTN